MQPCLVISQWIHAEVLELLSHSFRLIVNVTREPLPREELLDRSREADALMVFGPDVINRSFVKACPRMKIIAATFEGSQNVDVAACTESGIWFTSIQHDSLLTPSLEPTTDELRRLATLEAAACIFEALNGEIPKGAMNNPLKEVPHGPPCTS